VKKLALFVASSLLSGCIYANVNTPLSYRWATRAEVGGGQLSSTEATGESCASVILGLVAWGDAGYNAAVESAKASSGASLLADVRADASLFNVLFVYQRACTRVVGKVVK
jgi:hypothetical protein